MFTPNFFRWYQKIQEILLMRIRIKLIIISIHQYNFSQCTAPSAKMNPLLFLKQSNRQSIGNAIFAKPSL